LVGETTASPLEGHAVVSTAARQFYALREKAPLAVSWRAHSHPARLRAAFDLARQKNDSRDAPEQHQAYAPFASTLITKLPITTENHHFAD
jgi:hypothetical protein